MTKVGFVSLGCPKNLVDSEVMMGILSRGGYELTPRADEAEVLVVNTCSFIEAAQKESVEAILEMAEHKKFGAAKKLVVVAVWWSVTASRFWNTCRKWTRWWERAKWSESLKQYAAICGCCRPSRQRFCITTSHRAW